MSRFASVAENQTTLPPFVKSDQKATLVENEVEFYVVSVRGPMVSNFPESPSKMRSVETWYLDIEFVDPVVVESLRLEPKMTLSFTAGYEGRDALIKAAREDSESGDMVRLKLRGDKKFYSLALA